VARFQPKVAPALDPRLGHEEPPKHRRWRNVEGRNGSVRYFVTYDLTDVDLGQPIVGEVASLIDGGRDDGGSTVLDSTDGQRLRTRQQLEASAEGRAALAEWDAGQDWRYQRGAIVQADKVSADWDAELERFRQMGPIARADWYIGQGASLEEVGVYVPELAGRLGLPGPDSTGVIEQPVPPEQAHVCAGAEGLEAWRRWRAWLRTIRNASHESVRNYTGNVLRFLAETGCKAPGEYREDDVVDFLEEWARQGRPKHEYLKALRSFFGWAVRTGRTPTDPTMEARSRKPRRVPAVVLSAGELDRLVAAAQERWGDRVGWAILLIYSLGLRRKEAAGLKWEHVVPGPEGAMIEIHETKGADKRDPLPLSPFALQCLAALKELPRMGWSTLGPEFIIGVRPATIQGWIHEAGTRAGLHPTKMRAHRLRATLATDLLKSGTDIRVVQKILGHVRLESTAWYLGAVETEEVRRALAGVRAAIPAESEKG
jgi:site-specific recombinase XerD